MYSKRGGHYRKDWTKLVQARLTPAPVAVAPARRPRRGLRPEEQLQIKAIALFRPLLMAIGGQVFGYNGEISGGRGGQEARFAMMQMRRVQMGYVPGTPDLWIVWPSAVPGERPHLGVIELKRPESEPDMLGRTIARGELSTSQREFRDWFQGISGPHAVARTLGEIEAALRSWGIRLPKTGVAHAAA